MSKFKIGDRVQIIGDPTDYDLGTVIECKSSFGEDYCDVEWDVSGTYGQDEDSIFLVFRDGIFYPATAQTPSQADIELRAELDDCREPDPVNHPSHYTLDPSNVECITITRHRNFNVGNAIKYLWRNGLKQSGSLDGNAKQIEDLEKAVFYIRDEIQRLKDSK